METDEARKKLDRFLERHPELKEFQKELNSIFEKAPDKMEIIAFFLDKNATKIEKLRSMAEEVKTAIRTGVENEKWNPDNSIRKRKRRSWKDYFFHKRRRRSD